LRSTDAGLGSELTVNSRWRYLPGCADLSISFAGA